MTSLGLGEREVAQELLAHAREGGMLARVFVHVVPRILAMAAAIWRIDAEDKRSLRVRPLMLNSESLV